MSFLNFSFNLAENFLMYKNNYLSNFLVADISLLVCISGPPRGPPMSGPPPPVGLPPPPRVSGPPPPGPVSKQIMVYIHAFHSNLDSMDILKHNIHIWEKNCCQCITYRMFQGSLSPFVNGTRPLQC